MSKPAPIAGLGQAGSEPDWLELVRRQVGSLRYGIVQIVVHDGRVIQIEKTERLRLERARPDRE